MRLLPSMLFKGGNIVINFNASITLAGAHLNIFHQEFLDFPLKNSIWSHPVNPWRPTSVLQILGPNE